MSRPRDPLTLDLFRDYAPDPAVKRFAPEQIRAASLRERMSRAVSETLRGAGLTHAEAADRMSQYLQETVPGTMLAAYACQVKEHTIPATRLVALVKVAGDVRALNALLQDLDLIVVEKRYERLIETEKLREVASKIERRIAANEAEWRAGR